MANKSAGKTLKRSKSNKMVLGVCAGLGNYFDIDPTIVRLATVLVAVFTGFVPVLIVYVIAGIVIPE